MAMKWHRGLKKFVPHVTFDYLQNELDNTTCEYPRCTCEAAIEREILRREAEWEQRLLDEEAIIAAQEDIGGGQGGDGGPPGGQGGRP